MAIHFELADHVVGIMIDRDVTKEYLDEIHGLIEKKLKLNDHINLYCEIMPESKVPFKFLIENIKFKFDHADQIKRMAMVTDLGWVRHIVDLDKFLLSTEVRTYELEDRLEAINWVTHE